MAEITKFDFDGLSDQHVQVHEEYGPLVQAHNFIRWAGWSNTHGWCLHICSRGTV